ncbi:hypothetical protein B0H11DRAFT_2198948 [Mycena galericulata]|nr:hypothetical protein B0H11DRAFT_2198948 [Mycena galericulata]
MTVYLYVQASPPPLVQVRRNTAAKAPAPKITPVGPFLFQSSLSYADFLAMLAKGCRTKANHLPVNSMEWKFDCPTNSAKKPLSNADGYTAMIKTVKDRRKDFVFSVYMPPPSVVKSELPWHTIDRAEGDEDDGNGGGPLLDFEYNVDELTAPSSSSLSIREQIAGIDAASNPHLQELLERYPVDNSPLFPGKRIYHNETGYFELNDIKLRVWAVAKAKGAATLDRPPNSNHFMKSQTICPPTTPVPPPVALMLSQPKTSLLSNDSLMLRLLLLNTNPLLGMQLQSNIFPPLPALPPAPPTPAVISPPSVATPIKLPCEITIEEYCDSYQIKDDERRVLKELGYIPGDIGLTELTADDWAATKISPLGKGRILRQHAAFLKDVSDGAWDA